MKTQILIIIVLFLSFSISAQRKISTDKLQVKQTKLGAISDSLLVRDSKGNIGHIPKSQIISAIKDEIPIKTSELINDGVYVPYTGAQKNINLGYKSLTTLGQLSSKLIVARGSNPAIQINETSVNGVGVVFKINNVVPHLDKSLLIFVPNDNGTLALKKDIKAKVIISTKSTVTNSDLNAQYPLSENPLGTIIVWRYKDGFDIRVKLLVRISSSSWVRFNGLDL